MKPRLRAEGHGRIGGVDGRESEGFDIFCKLDIWWGSPIRRNSVLEGFRLRRFEVIQEEIDAMVDSSSEIAAEKLLGVKEMKS